MALLLLAAAVFAVPLVWMVLTSLKPAEQIAADPHRVLPVEWRCENYREAVTTMPYFRYLRNSLVLCAGSVLGTLWSCSLAAYAFARLRWPLRNQIFGVLVATMLLPWHVTMIPRFLLLGELGLYNSLARSSCPRSWAMRFRSSCCDNSSSRSPKS